VHGVALVAAIRVLQTTIDAGFRVFFRACGIGDDWNGQGKHDGDERSDHHDDLHLAERLRCVARQADFGSAERGFSLRDQLPLAEYDAALHVAALVGDARKVTEGIVKAL